MEDILEEMYTHLLSANMELHQLEENEWDSKAIASNDIQYAIALLREIAERQQNVY